MKRIYFLDGLCCANCAAKIEEAINRVEGVTVATVTFVTRKLTLETECDDQTPVLRAIQKRIHDIEPECDIIL